MQSSFSNGEMFFPGLGIYSLPFRYAFLKASTSRIPQGAHLPFPSSVEALQTSPSLLIRNRDGKEGMALGIHRGPFLPSYWCVTQHVGSQCPTYFLYGKCMPPALEELTHQVTGPPEPVLVPLARREHIRPFQGTLS